MNEHDIKIVKDNLQKIHENCENAKVSATEMSKRLDTIMNEIIDGEAGKSIERIHLVEYTSSGEQALECFNVLANETVAWAEIIDENVTLIDKTDRDIEEIKENLLKLDQYIKRGHETVVQVFDEHTQAFDKLMRLFNDNANEHAAILKTEQRQLQLAYDDLCEKLDVNRNILSAVQTEITA